MKIVEQLSEEEQKKLGKTSQPTWVDPTLARLTHEHFSDPDWIFERKLDGVRCIVYKKGKSVRLMSRNKKKMNDIYPELEKALKRTDIDFVADGEIVTFDRDLTSFSKLQDRINVHNPGEDLKKKVPVYLYLFDLMHVEGYDVTGLSLRTRKKLLQSALSFRDPLRLCTHKNEHGEKYLEEACKRGWEGLIAKDTTKPYLHSRTSSWLKFKCVHRQELVIGGYTDPEGSRKGFGALLVGYYDDDQLKYAGKIGTGFSDQLLQDLHKKMEKLERKTNPFDQQVSEKHVHWITPELVAEVGFTEWTGSNKLRHPRFIGLRHDKNAEDVVKEA
jgi:DNA ligase D-like protein (predicted ligase)